MEYVQLAPMQGLVDVFFMNTYQSIFGGFTEMMLPYFLVDSKSPKKKYFLKKQFEGISPNIKPIPQILSNDAKEFVKIANLLYQMGYEQINLNLGCPFPLVTKKMRGSGWLPHPEKLQAFLAEIFEQIKPKLSLKVRLGLYSEKEIIPLISVFNQLPISQLIIHPRTAAQKYEGKADRKYFYEIFPLFNMPIIYNGDILRKEEVLELKANKKKIQGIMIGRGAFINPFITNQINGIALSEDEKRHKYKTLHHLLYQHYKEKTQNEIGFLARMKTLWFYFSQSFEQGEKHFEKIKKTNKTEVFKNETSQILDKSKFLY